MSTSQTGQPAIGTTEGKALMDGSQHNDATTVSAPGLETSGASPPPVSASQLNPGTSECGNQKHEDDMGEPGFMNANSVPGTFAIFDDITLLRAAICEEKGREPREDEFIAPTGKSKVLYVPPGSLGPVGTPAAWYRLGSTSLLHRQPSEHSHAYTLDQCQLKNLGRTYHWAFERPDKNPEKFTHEYLLGTVAKSVARACDYTIDRLNGMIKRGELNAELPDRRLYPIAEIAQYMYRRVEDGEEIDNPRLFLNADRSLSDSDDELRRICRQHYDRVISTIPTRFMTDALTGKLVRDHNIVVIEEGRDEPWGDDSDEAWENVWTSTQLYRVAELVHEAQAHQQHPGDVILTHVLHYFPDLVLYHGIHQQKARVLSLSAFNKAVRLAITHQYNEKFVRDGDTLVALRSDGPNHTVQVVDASPGDTLEVALRVVSTHPRYHLCEVTNVESELTLFIDDHSTTGNNDDRQATVVGINDGAKRNAKVLRRVFNRVDDSEDDPRDQFGFQERPVLIVVWHDLRDYESLSTVTNNVMSFVDTIHKGRVELTQETRAGNPKQIRDSRSTTAVRQHTCLGNPLPIPTDSEVLGVNTAPASWFIMRWTIGLMLRDVLPRRGINIQDDPSWHAAYIRSQELLLHPDANLSWYIPPAMSLGLDADTSIPSNVIRNNTVPIGFTVDVTWHIDTDWYPHISSTGVQHFFMTRPHEFDKCLADLGTSHSTTLRVIARNMTYIGAITQGGLATAAQESKVDDLRDTLALNHFTMTTPSVPSPIERFKDVAMDLLHQLADVRMLVESDDFTKLTPEEQAAATARYQVLQDLRERHALVRTTCITLGVDVGRSGNQNELCFRSDMVKRMETDMTNTARSVARETFSLLKARAKRKNVKGSFSSRVTFMAVVDDELYHQVPVTLDTMKEPHILFGLPAPHRTHRDKDGASAGGCQHKRRRTSDDDDHKHGQRPIASPGSAGSAL